MSTLEPFAAALWVGLAIAAPVGPIGLLVIQRTLRHGRAAGLATGLGAAAADALYGALGAFGVTALIDALQAARVPLALAGGGFLLWLAWRTWRSAPPAQAVAQDAEVAGRPGDAARGRAVFTRAGCAACHRLGDTGDGRLAADIGGDVEDAGLCLGSLGRVGHGKP